VYRFNHETKTPSVLATRGESSAVKFLWQWRPDVTKKHGGEQNVEQAVQ
jgi:hypothetical protein